MIVFTVPCLVRRLGYIDCYPPLVVAVMVFVRVAGIELDLKQAWAHRREGRVAARPAWGWHEHMST